jgi:phytanoyl-CoA hydroxylase
MPLTGADAWNNSLCWIDRPNADISGYVSGSGWRGGFDLGARLKEWRERGIVIFEGAASPALIDEYLADIAEMKSHHKDYDIGVELAGTTRPIRDYQREDLDSDRIKFNLVHSISRAACLLSLTREACEFLGHVFGSPACVLQSLTFTKGSQQPIHLDYPYVRSQTRLAHLAASWIALEDIDPLSGPLAYYPGSHRPGVIRPFDWGGGSILLEQDSSRTPMDFAYYLWAAMEDAGIAPVTYCPRKGDLLIWHGALAHEGTPIRAPELTRMSYVTHYTSLEGYPPGHMKPGAMSNGAYICVNGGYAFELPWQESLRKLPSWERRQ